MEHDSGQERGEYQTSSRRQFMQLVGGLSVAATLGQTAGAETATESSSVSGVQDGTVGTLSFYSTASQIAPDDTALTDDSVTLVRAEDTAYNVNEVDSSDDAVIYEDESIPLVSEDGSVVGFGTANFVSDGNGGFDEDNEQFLVNLFEEKMGEETTVAWDEGHGQFWTLDNYATFQRYAADEGHEISATSNLLEGGSKLTFPSTASQLAPGGNGALTDPEHVVVWAESTAENVDSEGEDSYIYTDEPIPLVSRSGSVFGFGTPELVTDEEITDPNEQFLLNVLEETVGDAGTVVWDDAHDTFYDSSKYSQFADRLESEGYDFEASDDLLGSSGSAIEQLEFFSTASLLDENQQPLTDPTRIAVWAESTASNQSNQDGLVEYPADTDIPLIAVDGGVVGIGAALAPDASEFDQNRQVLVNAWEERLGGTGTILFDESHGQADSDLSLADYSQLESLAEDRGFAVEATADLLGDLSGADAMMITSPDGALESFSDAELDALDSFVADGGVLFLHDTADFEGHSSSILNDIAVSVGASFRFNSDQVVDEQNSGFASFVPRTGNFNDSFEWFTSQTDGQSDIENADAIAIASPSSAYTDAELTALSEHVADGGAVLLFDQSDFDGFDETDNLNTIAEALGVSFSFNADQVQDTDSNAGVEFVPTTATFNDSFSLFDGIAGVGFDNADGVVVTSPGESFSDEELDALASFVDDGGAVFLFDQSEFRGFEETANLNTIADGLGLSFRFNGDQVEDEQNNTGSVFDVATANYDASRDVFDERANRIGIEFDQDETYYGKVIRVDDGDTVQVEFDSDYGYTQTLRLLGIDTAETGSAENDTREWFGIGDDKLDHINTWGENGTDRALELLAPEGVSAGERIDGRHVRIEFDASEPVQGNFGRLLTYLYYDEAEFQPGFDAGDFETEFNRKLIEDGYARVYSSGFSNHDSMARLEERALANREGVWGASEFASLPAVRNDPVSTVFVPRATAITSASGTVPQSNIVVSASDTAEADIGADEIPLVAADQTTGVAVIGGLLIHEAFDEDDDPEEFPPLEGYQNFPLVANLAETLSAGHGPVLVDGGHGQFGADGALSLEDCKTFVRYLEGVGTRLRQTNDLASTLPTEPVPPRAIIITPPAEPFTTEELQTLQEFQSDGGMVLLLGSASAPSTNLGHLNDVAAALGTDLRLSDAAVTDSQSNFDDNPALLRTSQFNDQQFSVFGPATFEHTHVTAYLRDVANEELVIDISALSEVISDWRNDDIGYSVLQTAIDAYSAGDPVLPGE